METSDSTVGVMAVKKENIKSKGGMITRSLVGCLFRLEHPKGGRDGKQGSLFISELLPLIYIYD